MSLSIHTFSLLADPDQIQEYRGLLSDDEIKRADRFRFDVHRTKFIVARRNLRMTLSEYVGLEPKAIRFNLLRHGKPYIQPEQNPSHVSFNLSHSHESGAVVVCRGNDIGIDLEYIEKDRPFMDLADRYFHPAEVRHLKSLNKEEFQDAFYSIWTLKEAWLKATGMGIMGLHHVRTAPDGNGSYLIDRWGQGSLESSEDCEPSDTRLFRPVPGYIAAYTRLYSSQITSTI